MIRLAVKVAPKASSDRIQGWADGKANKAVVALLAKRLKLPKSAIIIASGETARRKTLLIDAEDGLLAQLSTE